MKTSTIKFIVFSLAVMFFACDEVVQDELDNKGVIIISPTNELSTTILTHTFLWQEVDKAEGYILQIASPSFKEIQQFILNEDLEETTFDFTFSPGVYEWRIKAYNNISETPYTTFTINIDSSLDLTGSKVITKSPADNYAINSAFLTFEWNKISVADEYRLEIRTPDWNNGSQAIYPVITEDDLFTNTAEPFEEGTYAWAVSAENDFSKSGFSTPRIFTIDLTSPADPALKSPANNALLVDSTFTFSWTRPTDSGSEITDSLYVYTDINKINIVRSIVTQNQFLTDSLGKGKYYWNVISRDAAGNKSNFSTLWAFTIQ